MSLFKQLAIIGVLAFFAFGFLFYRQYQSHVYFQEHPFKYAVGARVKVRDANCFVVKQIEGGFMSDHFEELYDVCIENTNTHLHIKGSDISDTVKP